MSRLENNNLFGFPLEIFLEQRKNVIYGRQNMSGSFFPPFFCIILSGKLITNGTLTLKRCPAIIGAAYQVNYLRDVWMLVYCLYR